MELLNNTSSFFKRKSQFMNMKQSTNESAKSITQFKPIDSNNTQEQVKRDPKFFKVTNTDLLSLSSKLIKNIGVLGGSSDSNTKDFRREGSLVQNADTFQGILSGRGSVPSKSQMMPLQLENYRTQIYGSQSEIRSLEDENDSEEASPQKKSNIFDSVNRNIGGKTNLKALISPIGGSRRDKDGKSANFGCKALLALIPPDHIILEKNLKSFLKECENNTYLEARIQKS